MLQASKRFYWYQVLLELNGQGLSVIPDNYRTQQIAFLLDESAALNR